MRKSLLVLGIAIPLKDCPNCVYRVEEMRDGGHCYMFRDEPIERYCGQFQNKDQRKANR